MISIIDNLTYILSALIVGRMYIGLEVVRQRSRHFIAGGVCIIFLLLSFFWGSDIYEYPLFFIALNIIVKLVFDVSIKFTVIFSFIFVNLHVIFYIGATVFVESVNRVLKLDADSMVPIVCSIGVCVALFIFGLLARKYTLLGTGKIKKNRILLIVVILGIDIFILTAVGLFALEQQDEAFMIRSSILNILVTSQAIIQFVAIVYLATARDTFKEREELVQIYLQEQKQHYEYLSKKEYETKKFRHDLKNHLHLIGQMCENNDIAGVEKYLSEINVHIEKFGNKIKTHNDIADAIFNRYYQNCKDEEVELLVQGHFPMDCSIAPYDLCTILSNTLDNALKAELEAEGSIISVNIRNTDDGKIIITVENDYKNEPKQQNGKFLTSKKDKNNHGFGLENIKDCVDRYNGITNITAENNKFTLWIWLDNRENEDSGGR